MVHRLIPLIVLLSCLSAAHCFNVQTLFCESCVTFVNMTRQQPSCNPLPPPLVSLFEQQCTRKYPGNTLMAELCVQAAQLFVQVHICPLLNISATTTPELACAPLCNNTNPGMSNDTVPVPDISRPAVPNHDEPVSGNGNNMLDLTDAHPEEGSSTSTGAIVGITIGCVLAAVLVVGVVLRFRSASTPAELRTEPELGVSLVN
eukprot:gnl/Spiro4/1272_TR684_c0_g1_i1.p1 gnl/Spiro4/1272_TR684_c0_g1~~gnl/Spiro4/1272_TR684_c0_g1_i1.p1  ORF type:complete len:214 (+),score=44.81 gnl/Spiro4/1272_TR684_c0_g1_i1:35-643(+)